MLLKQRIKQQEKYNSRIDDSGLLSQNHPIMGCALIFGLSQLEVLLEIVKNRADSNFFPKTQLIN